VFAIYFVCTGNRCRSPLAAAIMARLTAPLQVSVGSAGTLEMPGEAPPAETVTAADRLGIDLAGHVSRPLSRVDLTEADLVIGFERRHVAAAVVEGGAPADRAFNLVELASLLRAAVEDARGVDDPIERARRRIAVAHHLRVQTARFVPGEEVLDPIGLPLQAHVEMAKEVDDLCAVVAAELFGDDALR
jgi:protein-tyrosine-phosphatase